MRNLKCNGMRGIQYRFRIREKRILESRVQRWNF